MPVRSGNHARPCAARTQARPFAQDLILVPEFQCSYAGDTASDAITVIGPPAASS